MHIIRPKSHWFLHRETPEFSSLPSPREPTSKLLILYFAALKIRCYHIAEQA